MRIYETDNHAFRANAIRKKLETYAKNNLNFEERAKELLYLNDVSYSILTLSFFIFLKLLHKFFSWNFEFKINYLN